MQSISKKLAACAAVAALGAAGLFAQPPAARRAWRAGRPLRVMAAVLNLSAAQKAQAKTIFQEAHQSALPIRQQWISDRKSLSAAVQAGDNDKIQQLSAAVGNDAGKLTAIQSQAFAKVYQTLTPEQKAKWTAFEQAMHSPRRGPGAGSPSGSAASD